jgi:hypothetical protein
MMWRVADLLAVSPHDRIALRQRAAGQTNGRQAAGRQAFGQEVGETAGSGPDEAGT